MAGEDTTPVDRGDDFTPTAADRAEAAARADNASILEAARSEPVSNVVEQTTEKTTDDTEVEDQKAAPEQPRDEKGKFIPKSRFDEAVQKEREKAELAQRQVAELQKQLQTQEKSVQVADLEKQLDDLRDKQNDALLDGDKEKAKELGRQADRINRQIMVAESQTISTQATEQAREAIRVDTAIERLEEIYPALKEGSEEFDQGLVDLVLGHQQLLINRDRMTPSQALTKAANDIMSRFQAPAKVDEKPAGGLKDAKGADRVTAQKQKNIDTALKTPPSTTDVGLDTDKAGMKDGLPAPANIDDLKQIPESVLKRMRGDMV